MKKLVLQSAILFLVYNLSSALCFAQEKGMNIITGKPPFATLEEKQAMAISRRGAGPLMKAPAANISFRNAAAKALPGVVHILSTYHPGLRAASLYPYSRYYQDDLWPNSLHHATDSDKGSASGVLLSNDGYIATNSHVVKGTREIEVILYNQLSYKARIVGMDSLTDLALIKIDDKDLPFVTFGASDSVSVGDWVLAIGNPFNLASTVTAGIISAKSRTINTLEEKGGLHSFIQTDAVMNDGCSGGALVDVNGKLVGVNTGIITPTGDFAGYAFSIPVEIVKKVCNDLLRYGVAHRAYMGIFLKDVEDRHGVQVDSLLKGGPAAKAGIRPGDRIVAVENRRVEVEASVNEIMLMHHPGDQVTVTVVRNYKEHELKVVLDDCEDTVSKMSLGNDYLLNVLGIEVRDLDTNEKELLNIKSGGVRVIKVRNGKIFRSTSIEPGFIILELNGRPVRSRVELLDVLKSLKGRVMVAGIYDEYPQALYYAAFEL